MTVITKYQERRAEEGKSDTREPIGLYCRFYLTVSRVRKPPVKNLFDT